MKARQPGKAKRCMTFCSSTSVAHGAVLPESSSPILIGGEDESPDAHRAEGHGTSRAGTESAQRNQPPFWGRRWTLHSVFDQTMRVLAERLGMERGSLVLRDEMTGKLHTETAVGLTPEENPPRHLRNSEGITVQS